MSATGERPPPPGSCFPNSMWAPQSSGPRQVPHRPGPQNTVQSPNQYFRLRRHALAYRCQVQASSGGLQPFLSAVHSPRKPCPYPQQPWRKPTHPALPCLYGEQFLRQHLVLPTSSTRRVWAASTRNSLWPPCEGRGLPDRAQGRAQQAGNSAQRGRTARRRPRKAARRQAPRCCLWGRCPGTATTLGSAAISVALALCSCPALQIEDWAGVSMAKCSVLLLPLPRTGGVGWGCVRRQAAQQLLQ